MRRLFLLLSTIAYCSCSPQRYDERQDASQLQAYVKFSPADIRHLRTRGYALPVATASPIQYPSGFRNTIPPLDNSVASTHQRRPAFEEENYPVPNALIRPQKRPGQLPQQFRQQLDAEAKEAALKEEEEKEEPDRLSLLLPNSKFDCSGKVTGYYADEGLNCEVFHYCQDNAKHSWICPEGFTFHQVHLICMPPSNENICEKSSQFHFVNDYLYKPINEEEHQNKPNVTLRYSERYYPQNFYDRDEEEEPQHVPHKQPLQVGFQKQQPQLIPLARPRQPLLQPTFRPETQIFRNQQPHGQVFHSPEEVNISLQQRRPYFVQQRSFQTNREQDENE